MQKEPRSLALGIDADSAPYAIEDGALLNCVNVRSQRQRGQQGGRVNWLPGNAELSAVTAVLSAPGTSNTLLGKCVDDTTGKIYLFFHYVNAISGDRDYIVAYDTAANTAAVIIDHTKVTGGLGWTVDTYISCAVADDMLFFTENTHDVRYLNLQRDYMAGVASQGEITLLSEPGFAPPTAARVDVTGASSSIQTIPVQFSYRVVNTSGFKSVLAPLSLASFPPRESEIEAAGDAGNAITVTIPTSQQIPADWKQVDLVARFPDSNTFFIIKSWKKGNTADETAVTAHNGAFTALSIVEWTGTTLEALDASYSAKQSDTIPIRAKALTLAANRLFLGNITEGYDTPLVAPTVSLTPHTYTTNLPAGTACTMYMVGGYRDGASTGDFAFYTAIFIEYGADMYLLPREYSLAVWNVEFGTGAPTGIMYLAPDKYYPMPPRSVALSSLIKMPNMPDLSTAWALGDAANKGVIGSGTYTLYPFLAQAHNGAISEGDIDPAKVGIWKYVSQAHVSSGGYLYGMSDEIYVTAEPAELGAGGESRAFLPGTYRIGARYYDDGGRSSGGQTVGTLTIDDYAPGTRTLTEYVTAGFTAVPGSIPSWATRYSINMSLIDNVSGFGAFVPNLIKVAVMDENGDISIQDNLFDQFTSHQIVGLAVPLASLTRYKTNFAVVNGSPITLAFMDESNGWRDPATDVVFKLTVRQTIAGYLITSLPANAATALAGLISSSVIRTNNPYHDVTYGGVWLLPNSNGGGLNAEASNQSLCFVTVYNVSQAQSPLYEHALFGPITGGAYGAVYGTARLYGNAHTQKRESTTGGGTLYSSQSNESTVLTNWVTDAGRVSPADSVGQSELKEMVRWSNARIPGASESGYASFDAADYKTVDATAGGIVALVLTTRGIQDGGQMLVLSEHGSFAALVGQQQIAGADGNTAFTASVAVLGNFSPLRGGWGCQSPRSVVVYQGRVWWVDAYRRNVIEFNESGAGNISNFKAARLFNQLLSFVGNPMLITAGIDPFAAELMVSLPATEYGKADLATVTGLPDPLDAGTGTAITYRYQWEMNKWVGSYLSGAEFVSVGDTVYGWLSGKLWKEFKSTNGTYYGVTKNAMIVIPFNGGYPAVKSPLSLTLDGQRVPDKTWIVVREAADAVAGVQPYRTQREGTVQAAIMRNRVGFGAATTSDWETNGIRGARLKGAVIIAVLIWNGTSATEIALNTATLGFDVSSGH